LSPLPPLSLHDALPISRRLAPGEEAGIAGHLPDLAEYALGGLQDREVDVGADIEDADFERRMLVGVIEERDNLILLARIERTRVDRKSTRLNSSHGSIS